MLTNRDVVDIQLMDSLHIYSIDVGGTNKHILMQLHGAKNTVSPRNKHKIFPGTTLVITYDNDITAL